MTSRSRPSAERGPDAARLRDLVLDDILVVAPFNAQVRFLRDRLPRGARVGTVDKFQGQEAPVVFFSMTASSGEDVPRGMDFLFSRNRLNVAVSRGQWCAVIIRSPDLTAELPTRPDRLAELGAFLGLDEEPDVGRSEVTDPNS